MLIIARKEFCFSPKHRFFYTTHLTLGLRYATFEIEEIPGQIDIQAEISIPQHEYIIGGGNDQVTVPSSSTMF
ncbi:hypothetical protein [Caldisalinibacter kiritimatiensis]|uniref:Uncharacterized protein n=1 Tax=Caldisalinibacter kiritimatiensis TaxID=1304284 RepID=R1AUD2_9FIRM|nr:hypothetical protein [Caldisalinibacter kiritimatiensis]EOD00773.1 hypothetical protein L21TH_1174 [Caldisalinibacter kiritimatiensis]